MAQNNIPITLADAYKLGFIDGIRYTLKWVNAMFNGVNAKGNSKPAALLTSTHMKVTLLRKMRKSAGEAIRLRYLNGYYYITAPSSQNYSYTDFWFTVDGREMLKQPNSIKIDSKYYVSQVAVSYYSDKASIKLYGMTEHEAIEYLTALRRQLVGTFLMHIKEHEVNNRLSKI
jgi:hypothetical protein